MSDSSDNRQRNLLSRLFGDTVQVRIMEILLNNNLKEQQSGEVVWENFSVVAKQAGVAKSSGKRILDQLISSGFIEEKKYETHAQNPPRLIRLRSDQAVIRELLFFFKKARGFL